MYYRASGPFEDGDFKFLDYWLFFRFNKFNGGDHEADWEHITVARAAEGNPSTFAWVGMSAHNDATFRYLRDILRCDNNLTQGSCGTESNKTGSRPVTFIANGSHAIYPEPCSVPSGAAGCPRSTSDGSVGVTEKGYDGANEWGADSDPAALRRWPDDPSTWELANADPHWVNWPGRWGLKDGESHVESPGAPSRNIFYEPWTWECSERGTPDETDDCGDSSSAVSASGTEAAGTPAVTAEKASQCDEWAGPGLALAVCDPVALRHSLRDGSLGVRVERPRAALNGARRASTRSGGVTQVAGTPLKPGQELTLDRPLAEGESVRVNIQRRGIIQTAYFRPSKGLSAITVRVTDAKDHRGVMLGRGARSRSPDVLLRKRW